MVARGVLEGPFRFGAELKCALGEEAGPCVESNGQSVVSRGGGKAGILCRKQPGRHDSPLGASWHFSTKNQVTSFKVAPLLLKHRYFAILQKETEYFITEELPYQSLTNKQYIKPNCKGEDRRTEEVNCSKGSEQEPFVWSPQPTSLPRQEMQSPFVRHSKVILWCLAEILTSPTFPPLHFQSLTRKWFFFLKKEIDINCLVKTKLHNSHFS